MALVVEHYSRSAIEHLTWTEKKERIAEMLVKAGAINSDNAVTAREINAAINTDYANLKKVLEKMPGIVAIVATVYKSSAPLRYYYSIEMVEEAKDNNYYPRFVTGGILDKQWPKREVIVPSGMSHEQARRTYDKEWRGTDTPIFGSSGKPSRAVVTKAPMPQWVTDLLKQAPEGTELEEITIKIPKITRPYTEFAHDTIRDEMHKATMPGQKVNISALALNLLAEVHNYRTQKENNK